MAYDLNTVNGYGTGALGDVTNPTGQICSYANITAYTTSTITIGSPSNGVYEKFAVGSEIMIHVSATDGTSQEYIHLGKYMVCKITAISGNILTIDKDFTKILPAIQLNKYKMQAITIPQFANLTISTGKEISPITYNVASGYGGLLLFKCSDTCLMQGSSRINLVDKGIPVNNGAYRPLTAQELCGIEYTANDISHGFKYLGWENHVTVRQLLLNCGDGIVALWAKKFICTNTESRIGGTTAGVQYTCANHGGSTIMIVAGNADGINPNLISKKSKSTSFTGNDGTGRGIGRCYIASDTKLPLDEGLYAYDCLSNPNRIMQQLKVKSFGDGSTGDIVNPTVCLNQYAAVSDISLDGRTISYKNKTSTAIASIGVGALIMFHVSEYIDVTDMRLLGKFMLAKVISDDGTKVILDKSISDIFPFGKLNKYKCQIISVPQCKKITINNAISQNFYYDATKGTGGIIAIAASDLFSLNAPLVYSYNGGNFRENRTTNLLPAPYGREGLEFIGNTQMCDILPIGQGLASIFILAKCVINGPSSVIGSAGYYNNTTTKYGKNFGGISTDTEDHGGYRKDLLELSSKYNISPAKGSGIGSNGNLYRDYTFKSKLSYMQGCHIYAIIDEIDKFSLDYLNTGGCGVYPGGCGYGGAVGGGWSRAGAFIAGHADLSNQYGENLGGGGTGFMFLCVNKVNQFDSEGVVI